MGRLVLWFASVLTLVTLALVGPPRLSEIKGTPIQQSAVSVRQPVQFVSSAVEPSTYKQPCQNTSEDRQSDLCAQWRSADWSMWGTLVAIIGTFGLWIQIYYTQRAVKDTGDATEAMVEANKIARESMERQLRPYVAFTEANPGEEDDDGPFTHGGDFTIYVRNFGQTPAQDVTISSFRELRPRPIGCHEVTQREETNRFGKLSPTDRRGVTMHLSEWKTEELDRVIDGTLVLLYRFRLAYDLADGTTDTDDVTVMIDKQGWKRGETRLPSREDREAR